MSDKTLVLYAELPVWLIAAVYEKAAEADSGVSDWLASALCDYIKNSDPVGTHGRSVRAYGEHSRFFQSLMTCDDPAQVSMF